MIHVQLYTLKNLIGIRLEPSKEILGLFMHYWVIFLHGIVVEILVKVPTVLPPRRAVGHCSKAPVNIHPAHCELGRQSQRRT
jgi:hypothetical protein